jgi:antitoxin (DNA-binding transcriptional repressor) of toxin-antitoxin stability system
LPGLPGYTIVVERSRIALVFLDLQDPLCDAKMYHMRKASVRDLRYAFKKVERLLHQGEEIQITKRRRVIARLVPESAESAAEVPDFLGRLRTIYGDKVLAVSGAQLVSEDRKRY